MMLTESEACSVCRHWHYFDSSATPTLFGSCPLCDCMEHLRQALLQIEGMGDSQWCAAVARKALS